MTASAWQFFTTEELACRCCGMVSMDPWFMEHLVTLRRLVGFPLNVTSGYRCPAHNSEVSTTGPTGPHTTGAAVDIRIARDRATTLVKFALNQGFMGIGLRQHGPDMGRIVHLDLVPRPDQIIWTY